MNSKRVGIIGSGAWGTGVAQALARGGHVVQMYSHHDAVAKSVNEQHENTKYLPGYVLSPKVTVSTDIAEVADENDYLIIASPSLYVIDSVKKILNVPAVARGRTQIGVLTKGFVPTEAGPRLILDALEALLPDYYKHNIAYIAGPSHAEEVALGKLTGLITASENPKLAIDFRELLSVPGLMVYSSFDVIGVQICAAVKNVIAIVYGCLDAIAENSSIFGDNSESLLLAAGLNEIQTFGFAMGAKYAETFTSISGVGDLDVTCKSKYGRNRRFGRDIITTDILSHFKNLDDLITHISEIGYLPEGIVACKYVHQLAQERNVRLLICNGLYRILNREIEPEDFLTELLIKR
ncbi:MAG: NAD(P)-dependent glycerol-3-phosphate dehydrogenase [Treponema sp.]|nr:NAD(P)-dependent glycerol-3-phosphate dehydrogenase [Treponema sp.]